jgi:DNA-directed RNA polymerase specialized sigma24 family protein
MPEETPQTGDGRDGPSTHWSQIGAAAGDGPAAEVALGRFLLRYQAPLLAYLRAKFGARVDSPEDLFQAFVEGPVLTRGLLQKARPLPGHKFRSYLLSAWHRFAIYHLRRETCAKRRPPGGFQPLIEDDARRKGPPPELVPPPEFDLPWARWVIAEATRRMRQKCAEKDRADLWGVFEARIYGPIVEGSAKMPYGELVARFGLPSPTHARNLLVTAERWYRSCLNSVVGEYAEGEAAIEQELRELRAVLENGGAGRAAPW